MPLSAITLLQNNNMYKIIRQLKRKRCALLHPLETWNIPIDHSITTEYNTRTYLMVWLDAYIKDMQLITYIKCFLTFWLWKHVLKKYLYSWTKKKKTILKSWAERPAGQNDKSHFWAKIVPPVSWILLYLLFIV